MKNQAEKRNAGKIKKIKNRILLGKMDVFPKRKEIKREQFVRFLFFGTHLAL